MNTTCPRCSRPRVDDGSCPHCGIVYDKYSAEQSAPHRSTAPQRRLAGQLLIFGGIAAAVMAIAVWGLDGSVDVESERPGEVPAPAAAEPPAGVPVAPIPTILELDNASEQRRRGREINNAINNAASDYAENLDRAANMGRDDAPETRPEDTEQP